MPTRYFTVEEANAILPQLSDLLDQIQQARREIMVARPDLWPVLKRSIGNGGSKKAGELLPVFVRLQAATAAVEALGVHLKDLDQGLVDFLHRRPDGREVYLCWHMGEKEVLYWHELHVGYAGRQRL
jgi:hypothetical protein